MRAAAGILCIVTAAAPGLGGIELQEDPPLVRAPRSGNISGVITPAAKVTSLDAVSRVTGKVYPAGSFDKITGKFAVKNLPGDATYDLRVRTTDGRTLEGIDLDFVDHRMIRLSAQRRRQLGLPAEPPREFTRDDLAEVRRYVREMEDFCDIRRALYIRGHGRRATALVEMIRARDFYGRKGTEIVWRIELWYFEYRYGGWERLANQERVLHRKRMPHSQWSAISLEYYDALSVHVEPSGYCEPIEFHIPDPPDISRGRLPNHPPKIDSEPHVLGLAAKAENNAGDRPAEPRAGPCQE